MDKSHQSSTTSTAPAIPKLVRTNWKSIYIVSIVAFIAALEFAASNDWNYFCQLDSSATITFYGILRTIGGLSSGIATVFAGWVCNKLRNTREVLIVSKVLIFLSFCFFLSVELVHGFVFYLFFVLYKLLLGIANGGASMTRTHVAMASTEADRNKAIALSALLPGIGILLGFLLNAATSYLKYPGIEVPLISIHFNLFTAPMLFGLLVFCVALYLLIFHFDGKWHNFVKAEQQKQPPLHAEIYVARNNSAVFRGNGWVQKEKVITHQPPMMWRAKAALLDLIRSDQFDWISVGVCLFTNLVVSMAMLNILTINAPYQQLAFQWDAAELQFYGGLAGAAVAVQLIFWPAAYMVFGLNRIISERNSVMLGLVILLIGYLLTYSWPFLSETMPYAYVQFNNQTMASATAGSISSCGGSNSLPGCPAHYHWCATTTRPNMAVYIVSFVLTTGMAIPILRMNLDILYSKILGNIKQGIMQGLAVLCQGALEMAGGSIIVSWIFERSGPKHIWEFIAIQLALCFTLWLIFYKRMISNTERRRRTETQSTNSE